MSIDMTDYRIGIDIGGTFTDFYILDDSTGQTNILKSASTPTRPEEAIFNGLKQIFSDFKVDPGSVKYFIHGTTLAVNTIIQRNGLRTALLVTEGFRDILNIGRHRIPDVYNFFTDVSAPLVSRSDTYEISERSLSDGTIFTPVDEDAVRQAVVKMVANGVEAVAVCFLHSYRNGENERKARAVIEAAAPDLYVSLSSEIWPQMREYERALAAVMNAYVGQRMRRYFGDLERGVRALGIDAPVLSTKSNGGIMPASEAGARPVETLLSGPASGVIGAAFVGATSGVNRLITFDMGGTSADVAVIDGNPHYSTESEVGGLPVILPAVDVTSIGAGGGSIAWTDSTGVLKVGPRSAGAIPGPACYGRGGEEATVTDAYVVLGLIDPKSFLGGTVSLDRGLAEASLARLGARLGLGVRESAEAVLRVATSQMYAALVPLLARKGIDYEDYALLAFGGGGPCHAFMLAADVGISRVLVPLHPGTLCAAGSLSADVRKDLVQTLHCRLDSPQSVLPRIEEAMQRLSDEGQKWLDSLRLGFLERRVECAAEMRYVGQSFELGVAVDPAVAADRTGALLRDRFDEMYKQIYSYTDESAEVEVLDLRVTVVGVNPKPRMTSFAPRPADGLTVLDREIYFEGRTWNAKVYQRAELPAGYAFDGPAIVEQYDTTVFVTPGFKVRVDEHGNLIGEARHVH